MDLFPEASVTRAEKAVIAHLMEASGKNMLEKTPYELRSLKSHGLPAALAGIFIAKRYLPLVCREYPAVGNGGLVDIPGEIGQSCIGIIDAGFAVDHPAGFP